MLLRDNTWCPLIKDYCKGSQCVCHETKSKVDYTRPVESGSAPFCHHFSVYLPKGVDGGEPDGS